MSTTKGIDDVARFPVGMRVRYDVRTKAGADIGVPAVVVGSTRRRVIVQFLHWADGEMIRRSVRPYRLSPRQVGDER